MSPINGYPRSLCERIFLTAIFTVAFETETADFLGHSLSLPQVYLGNTTSKILGEAIYLKMLVIAAGKIVSVYLSIQVMCVISGR